MRILRMRRLLLPLENSSNAGLYIRGDIRLFRRAWGNPDNRILSRARRGRCNMGNSIRSHSRMNFHNRIDFHSHMNFRNRNCFGNWTRWMYCIYDA